MQKIAQFRIVFDDIICMDLWDRIKSEVRNKNTTQAWVAEKAGVPFGTFQRWLSQKTMPNADQAMAIAKALDTTVEFLLSGVSRTTTIVDPGLLKYYQKTNGKVVCENQAPYNSEVFLVPILDQKVAAGRGQEQLESSKVIGMLPFLKKMLRGTSPSQARALEVRGDSMTGIMIFDGDLVVFVPGELRGDGIYVLRVGDELLVKRVEFDPISRRIHIMSENPRYPDRIESADEQAVEVVGKVYGWVHSHPY